MSATKIFLGVVMTAAIFAGAAECDSGGNDSYETYEPDYESDYEPAEAEPAFSDEEIGSMTYALLLQTEYPGEFGAASEWELTNLGEAICSDFDSGMDVFSIALSMDNFDPLAASYAVGAAGPAFCPENVSAMEEQFRTFGN